MTALAIAIRKNMSHAVGFVEAERVENSITWEIPLDLGPPLGGYCDPSDNEVNVIFFERHLIIKDNLIDRLTIVLYKDIKSCDLAKQDGKLTASVAIIRTEKDIFEIKMNGAKNYNENLRDIFAFITLIKKIINLCRIGII